MLTYDSSRVETVLSSGAVQAMMQREMAAPAEAGACLARWTTRIDSRADPLNRND